MRCVSSQKNFYEEQFSAHVDTGSAVEMEADIVDQKLEYEIQNCPPNSFPITVRHIR
ncbi:unnamed protein product, partial [Didymodactylos carnosus]